MIINKAIGNLPNSQASPPRPAKLVISIPAPGESARFGISAPPPGDKSPGYVYKAHPGWLEYNSFCMNAISLMLKSGSDAVLLE
jgi:hypothetical protein